MSLLADRMAAPTHHGLPAGAIVRGKVGNPTCGDILEVGVRLEGDRIVAAGFTSLGSPFQLATASVVCELATGATRSEARALDASSVLTRLPDLPPHTRYLARMAVEALQRALDGPLPTAAESARMAEPAMGRDFVLHLLRDGKPMDSEAIERAAAAAGISLSPSPLRLLTGLRDAGKLEGRLVGAHWTWCVNRGP